MSIKINDKEDKTYIVLGAPGSATSFISKALEEQGVKMGNSKREDLKRFFENREFLNLNVKLLANAGGWWGEPPSREKIRSAKGDTKIIRLINKYKDKFWGFKDPRSALTVHKYLPHLDGDVYLICCFRKPEKVMARWERDGLTQGSKALVDRFNQDIIESIKEFVEL